MRRTGLFALIATLLIAAVTTAQDDPPPPTPTLAPVLVPTNTIPPPTPVPTATPLPDVRTQFTEATAASNVLLAARNDIEI
ncbi:MAG: M23 family peptidase, partial [Chloroflexota bacterium]